MHFKMSSAICFKLDQSKILSSGNGLTPIALVEWTFPSLISRNDCWQSLAKYMVLLMQDQVTCKQEF